jgi:hypothetical protein
MSHNNLFEMYNNAFLDIPFSQNKHGMNHVQY